MDQKELNKQSQHWENNFSRKPEMFGLAPSVAAKKSIKLFKEKNIKNIIELGAGLGRDTIFFAENSLKVNVLDYSPSAVKIINDKLQPSALSIDDNNISNYCCKFYPSFNTNNLTFSRSDLHALADSAQEQGIKKSRICTHANVTDNLHEMFHCMLKLLRKNGNIIIEVL